ncbi:MAG TPA: hypothetical protein EYG81_03845 [Archaeoglobus profundus]|nr:hypothetical protein [Archaeoglobus profundus]
MLKFTRFIKRIKIKLVVFSDCFQIESSNIDKFDKLFIERSAIIYIHPELAKKYGFKDEQVVKVIAGDRFVNLKLKIDDTAPRDGALMPRSIYFAYLSSNEVIIEPCDGELTNIYELLKYYKFK